MSLTALRGQAEEQPLQVAGQVSPDGREPAAQRLRGLHHRSGGHGGGVDRPAVWGQETALSVGACRHVAGRSLPVSWPFCSSPGIFLWFSVLPFSQARSLWGQLVQKVFIFIKEWPNMFLTCCPCDVWIVYIDIDDMMWTEKASRQDRGKPNVIHIHGLHNM